jgi:hypothetical protein
MSNNQTFGFLLLRMIRQNCFKTTGGLELIANTQNKVEFLGGVLVP